MSKVKAAKMHCGYEPKPILEVCGNCAAFRSDLVLPEWMVISNEKYPDNPYTIEKNGVEKNLRCEDHRFATKKMASCRLFRPKLTK